MTDDDFVPCPQCGRTGMHNGAQCTYCSGGRIVSSKKASEWRASHPMSGDIYKSGSPGSSGEIRLDDPSCPHCHGSGALPDELVCTVCRGRGQVRISVWERYIKDHPSEPPSGA